MKVVVTGAAGQISYSLIPFLCENGIFKSNEKIDFSLVEIPSAMEKLSGFVKELEKELNKFLYLDKEEALAAGNERQELIKSIEITPLNDYEGIKI